MTAVEPASVVLTETDPSFGCSRCGSQKTVLLHPHHGRLCSSHITLPPGMFRAGLAADMVDLGRADAAFAYLRAWMAREIDTRFAGPARALAGRERRRCWCGRPINDPNAIECAEHDAPAVSP